MNDIRELERKCLKGRKCEKPDKSNRIERKKMEKDIIKRETYTYFKGKKSKNIDKKIYLSILVNG